METEDRIGSIGSSRTYKKMAGQCGNIYITIVFRDDKPNRIDYLKLQGCTKTNDCGGSFMDSLADILTFAIKRIRNKYEAEAIIKSLSCHRCNKIKPNQDHSTSCVDAISKVLKTVLLNEEETESETTKINYRHTGEMQELGNLGKC